MARELLWDPDPSSSWWYLALPAPHSHSTIDVLHTLGSAVAVLGAALLLSRIPLVARLLEPLAAAGSMALTLYSAHLVLLATGLLADTPRVLYVLMVVGALTFAHFWRRRRRRRTARAGGEPGGRGGPAGGHPAGRLIGGDPYRGLGGVRPAAGWSHHR